MKLFIIEDEVPIREELTQFLEKYGFQCESSDDFHNIAQLAIKWDAVFQSIVDTWLPLFGVIAAIIVIAVITAGDRLVPDNTQKLTAAMGKSPHSGGLPFLSENGNHPSSGRSSRDTHRIFGYLQSAQ